MSPADLKALGEAMYGYGWQRAIARAFSINERTVRRWAEKGAPARRDKDLLELGRRMLRVRKLEEKLLAPWRGQNPPKFR